MDDPGVVRATRTPFYPIGWNHAVLSYWLESPRFILLARITPLHPIGWNHAVSSSWLESRRDPLMGRATFASKLAVTGRYNYTTLENMLLLLLSELSSKSSGHQWRERLPILPQAVSLDNVALHPAFPSALALLLRVSW